MKTTISKTFSVSSDDMGGHLHFSLLVEADSRGSSNRNTYTLIFNTGSCGGQAMEIKNEEKYTTAITIVGDLEFEDFINQIRVLTEDMGSLLPTVYKE